MKKSNKNFKIFAYLQAIILLGLTNTFAQVVKVPVGCNVVVAGVGGTTGPGTSTPGGGAVGSGGIVTMADPFSGGNFVVSGIPGTSTISGWALAGDISVQTGTTYNAAIQSAGSVATLNIESYNKKLRVTETTPSLARSKGRVVISYSDGSCGRSITFDIYKRYTTNLPIIVGPTCILPNTLYTYSVDQVASDNADDAIGFDKYYWSDLPPYVSSSVYYSADGSSITFKTAATLSGTSWTIKCSYGRANPWDMGILPVAAGTPTTFVTKTLGAAPEEPLYNASSPTTLVLSSTPGCVNTGLTSFTVNYPAPPVGTTYTWSAPGTTWNINTTSTSATFSNIGNNSGSIVLSIMNSCITEPKEFIYQIRRSFTAAVAITPTTGCLTPTVASSFSLGPNASINSTTWSVTPTPILGSFNITTDTPTTTATVTAAAGTTPGSYSLIATSTSCGGSVSIPIVVRRPAPVFTNTSPSCVVRGTTPVTSIQVDTSVSAGSPPTTGYVWTLPTGSGWTISAGANTSTPTFVPNGSTTGPIIVSVRLTGAGGCDSATATKSISYVYITTSPDPNSPGCDQYNLIGSGCYTGTPVWTIGGASPNGTTAFTNPFNTSLFICGSGTPPAPNTVCAQVMINGVSQLVCATTAGFHGLSKQGNANNSSTKELIDNVTIYPNPTNGDFVIRVDKIDSEGSATLIDSNGKRISSYALHLGDNDIHNVGLAQGTYFILLEINGKKETRKIIIK